MRPLLLLGAVDAVGGAVTAALPFACAVEMVHTYSLIHDDLPAMDDDALRRGKPTNHVVFGEALAILAGDALLTEAFRVMTESVQHQAMGRRGMRAMHEIAEAAGMRGMVAGQAADLDAEGTVPDLPTVEFIHVRKTGALILAAIRAGAILGAGRTRQLRALTQYGEFLGLAFQVADDILDLEGDLGVTGWGQDRSRNKVTYPAVLGLPAAKQRARDLCSNAIDALAPFPRMADPLRHLARLVAARAGDGAHR
jgi:geranylgeranyl diphosphate synthase type II